MTGFAEGLAVMPAGVGLFVLGWTVLVIGHRRWAQAAGVSFWRLAFVYGQERTDVRLADPFEAGFRYWRAAFARTPLADADADAARTLVRRGAILCGTGWATSGLGLAPRGGRPRRMRHAAAEGAFRWAEVWSRAWPEADVEAIAGLYSEDALFYSHPFRPPQPPGAYVEWAFGDQAEAECRFGHPVVAGDRAAVDWWAVVTARDGSVETLAGTSLLRFDADGLVVEQRDAWAGQAGRHELPDWAR